MPAPLIEFSQFAHPQRWWLRRGPPPWLDDSRWWVRAFRMSLVMGIVGTVSGWVSMGGQLLHQFLGELTPPTEWLGELMFLCGPGFFFGAITLVPLSRWLGRGWIMSLAAVPVSMSAMYCGMMSLFYDVSPIMSNGPDWIPRNACWFFAGFVGAATVSLWMGHPLRRTAWLAGMSAATLAGLGCGLYTLSPPDGNLPYASSQIGQFLHMGMLYVTFQSLTAVGLGMRLWVKDQENRFHSSATAVS